MNKEELILKIDLVLLMVLILCLIALIGSITGRFLNPGVHNSDFWAITNCSIGER